MRKLINDPAQFVDEMIDGILLAHPGDFIGVDDDRRVLRRRDLAPSRVGIVTGGGSGHLPLFLGYVGAGLCSAAAVGNVFSSPSAEQVLSATRAVNSGSGVLHLIGNYGGDRLNFALAADMAETEGVEVRTVIVNDDALSAPADLRLERRGVAGLVLAYKCAGASAERGDQIGEVERLTALAVSSMSTAGVGLSPTIMPTTGNPSFDLPEGKMEIGIGIHGEPGRRQDALGTADDVADELCEAVAADLELRHGERVVVLVNGLGATPQEELYLVCRRVLTQLGTNGIEVHRCYVGNYATSLEMAGASVSIMRVNDELSALVDAPATSPFFRQ